MKSTTILRSFLFLAGSSLLAISSASAQLYWDSNGATAGFGNAASTLGTSNFLNTDIAGGAGTFSTATTSSDNVNFGTATLNFANGTIGVAAGGVTVGSITIGAGQTQNIALGTTGNSVTLHSGITKNSTATSHTFIFNTSPVVLAASQTWTNNTPASTVTNELEALRAAAGINYGANTFTIDGIGVTGFTGSAITGSGNFIKNGTGSVVFTTGTQNNTVTFTGKINLNGGVARWQDPSSMGSGNIEINGGVLEGRFGGTFTRTQGIAANEIQITGGASGFSGQGTTGTGFNIGNIIWGSGTFNPLQFVLQSATTNPGGNSNLSSAIDLGSSTRTIRSDQSASDMIGGIGTFSGNISNGGITKEGIGTHVFSGTNSYAAGTTINQGTLRFSSIATMPNSGAVTVNTGANLGISLGGAGQWTAGTSGVGTLGGLLAGVGGAGSSTVAYSGNVGLLLNVTANSSFSGVIANPTGSSDLRLIKIGTGALELTGTNTYTGNTTLTQGVLVIGAAANLGNASSSLIFNGGTLRITGTSLTNVASLGRTMTFNSGAGIGFDINSSSNTFTLGQILNQGAGNFTKDGQGTLVLNQANTFTGLTTVGGGGNLVLDYSTGQDNRKLGTAGGLVFNGAGTITLKGGVASTVENSINGGTSLNAGGTFIARDGGTVPKIRLNGIARAAGGTISFADATIADTDSNHFGTSGANGILGGWATLGSDWAVSANTGAVNTAVTALASYSTFVNNVGLATANYLLNGSDTLASGTAAGSLKITNSANSQALALAANDLTITSTSATALGGILYAGGNDNLYSITGTGRIIPSTANQELIFAVQTGTLTVGSFVGAVSASSPVTKTGAGTLVLSAANTYTGATRINQGTLALGASDVFAATPFLIGNATLDAATFTDTVGTLDPTAGATINLGSGGRLAFAATNATDWTGGTLNLTGTFDFSGTATSSLRFGTSSGGLTAAQLALISSTGWTNFALNSSGYLTAVVDGGGPGPLDNFLISAIGSPQTVGTPITGITLTARDASNATVTSFTGTVNFGGTGGFTGTSATFTAGVLSGVSVIPTNAGSGLTFTVTDIGTGKTGSATITTIQAQYAAWAGGALFGSDANNDGVSNGMAFLLGASSPTSAVTLPTVTQSGGALTMVFTARNAASRGTASLSLEHSSDLGIGDPWTNVPVTNTSSGPTSGVTFTVTPGSPSNSVTATVSNTEAVAGKLFGRLKAVNP